MRICNDEAELTTHQTLAWFVDDVPGGCRIECGACGSQQDSLGIDTKAPYECGSCGKEILYPGWAEW